MTTVQELLGRPDKVSRADRQLLLAHALGRSRSWLYAHGDTELSDPKQREFERLLASRRQGQPVAYLLGQREFWSLALTVSPAVLIPRPETELLVELALQWLAPERTARVLDLGTGSGAIALALASERPRLDFTASDSSRAALAVARANAKRHRLSNLRFVHSDWFSALSDQRFDLIVANPPYIAADDPHLQRGDLRHEPTAALVAASQGLAALQHIVQLAPSHLNDGGGLLIEHGHQQRQAVLDLFAEAGFAQPRAHRDLAGQPRCVSGRWRASG